MYFSHCCQMDKELYLLICSWIHCIAYDFALTLNMVLIFSIVVAYLYFYIIYSFYCIKKINRDFHIGTKKVTVEEM